MVSMTLVASLDRNRVRRSSRDLTKLVGHHLFAAMIATLHDSLQYQFRQAAITVHDVTWLAAAMLLLWLGLAALNPAHEFVPRGGARFRLG